MTGEEKAKNPYYFRPWDVKALALMPDYIQQQFPFFLTNDLGIEKAIIHRLSNDILHGVGFLTTEKILKEGHMKNYKAKYLIYESFCNQLQQNRERSIFAGGSKLHKPFGDFSDKDGYAGFACSDNYLKDCWVKYYKDEIVFSTTDALGILVSLNREDYIKLYQQTIHGIFSLLYYYYIF